VLTPHTYLLNAATVFNGNLYLNAEGNADAVFIIQINGALSTSTYANVILTNGAQAKNVYWKVDGAVLINDYSEIKGTLVANAGAVDITTGVVLNGRAFTTTGALSTTAITAQMTVGCGTFGTNAFNTNDKATVYPNPFENTINVTITDWNTLENLNIQLYDTSGRLMKKVAILAPTTSFSIDSLTSGFYMYTISSNDKIIQTGKLISK
jgi:hypothetical protein